MKDHIKETTEETIRRKKNKMKKIRLILLCIVIVGLVISIYIHYWLAFLVAPLLIGVIWYMLPVKNVRIYPEDIRVTLQNKLHQLEDKEKCFGPNSELLLEEQEIRDSLYTLSHHETTFEE